MSINFVLAPDSFKESMTAKEVCIAMEKGIRKVFADANIIHVPMADGGEGTMQSLVDSSSGEIFEADVTGPLGNIVRAKYGILGDGETAVIEMAEASGIQLVSETTKNPLITTTYGTGELVKTALDKGIKKIIIGIGGSATNDGGAGFAQALGVKLLNKLGKEISFGGGGLKELCKIDVSEMDTRLKNVNFTIACDVSNPLCGKTGASHVFGNQKGATNEMIEVLDKNLLYYAKLIKEQLGKDIKDIPGSGAAGGLGAGLLTFTNSILKRGIDIVIETTNLREIIKNADYVFTGEGGIDFQTQFGKTPYGVSTVAKLENKKVIVVAGYIGNDIDILYDKGINAIFGILPGAVDIQTALKDGKKNIERTCENIARLINLK